MFHSYNFYFNAQLHSAHQFGQVSVPSEFKAQAKNPNHVIVTNTFRQAPDSLRIQFQHQSPSELQILTFTDPLKYPGQVAIMATVLPSLGIRPKPTGRVKIVNQDIQL